jgi:hypothetical protein
MADPSAAKSDVERRRRLNERLRAEHIAGAEGSGGKPRPGLTNEKLERVLRGYPGDV